MATSQQQSPSKTFHGGRALISMNGSPVGLWTTASFGMAYDVATINILGRMGPAELVYTGQEAVNINVSGFRIIGHGPFVDGNMPQIQNLLSTGYFEITILDRQTGQRIARFPSCKASGFNMNVSAKSPADLSMTFTALNMSDESVSNAEATGAADLP